MGVPSLAPRAAATLHAKDRNTVKPAPHPRRRRMSFFKSTLLRQLQ
jgi:hypothetical protein